MLRKTGASVVASMALLSPATAQAVPTTDQVVQAVADSAAETYRQSRSQILQRYRVATADAQAAFESAADRQLAWREYKRATQAARATADKDLKHARETFKKTVDLARGGA